MADVENTIEQPKPEKKRRKATLADLKPVVMVVEVDDIDEDGEPIALEFTLKALSLFQYNSIGMQVNDPDPETVGVDPKTKRPIFDTTSSKYRAALNTAANERMVRRLATALIEPEIPGDDVAAKSTWIQENMTPGIVGQLIMLMDASAKRGEARISNRADNFQ